MIIGVPKERFPGERRVALTPASAKLLGRSKVEVVVEAGAGVAAGFTDSDYESAGARVVSDRDTLFTEAAAIAVVRTVGADPSGWAREKQSLRRGQLMIGFAEPLSRPDLATEAAEAGVTLLAMELIPRISRAQSMDALSAMAMVAGYKATIIAAARLDRLFPLQMTAAGTVAPARVLVLGAGVAGLQAIATARRLGAVVTAYDIRPAAREEALSLGARFVELGLETSDAEAAGGYARAMDDEFYRRQREALSKVVAASEVLITTAAVPGKRAPVLVTTEMVKSMPAGAVVVDLAAERGGNCEPTRPDEEVQVGGATVLGPLNLPASVPRDASELYSRTVVNLVKHLLEDGELTLKADDPIAQGVLVCADGRIVNEQVQAASAANGVDAAAPSGGGKR
jgi:NAD(P) transhydrogenase subunit alpha